MQPGKWHWTSTYVSVNLILYLFAIHLAFICWVLISNISQKYKIQSKFISQIVWSLCYVPPVTKWTTNWMQNVQNEPLFIAASRVPPLLLRPTAVGLLSMNSVNRGCHCRCLWLNGSGSNPQHQYWWFYFICVFTVVLIVACSDSVFVCGDIFCRIV